MERKDAPKWFAEQMAVKLAENEHKGGWENCDPWWLLNRLRDEVFELEQALYEDLEPNEIIRECADVGNFAMMIADVIKEQG